MYSNVYMNSVVYMIKTNQITLISFLQNISKINKKHDRTNKILQTIINKSIIHLLENINQYNIWHESKHPKCMKNNFKR